MNNRVDRARASPSGIIANETLLPLIASNLWAYIFGSEFDSGRLLPGKIDD